MNIHLRNVTGLGASLFVDHLLSELNASNEAKIHTLFINEDYQIPKNTRFHCLIRKKYRFGFLSRLIEVLFFFLIYENEHDTLVMGDLPLNTKKRQIILLHQSLIFEKFPKYDLQYWKFLTFRVLFRLLLKPHDVVVVQTPQMKNKFIEILKLKNQVEILNFSHFLENNAKLRRSKRVKHQSESDTLKFIYPAAYYPHKNHTFLEKYCKNLDVNILLTIDEPIDSDSNPKLTYIGRISQRRVYNFYKEVDGLLFVSSSESLGLPLVEAVKYNIPIVCPRCDYSENLVSQNCFYFDLQDPTTLSVAVSELRDKLKDGWWPSWDYDELYNGDDRLNLSKVVRKYFYQ